MPLALRSPTVAPGVDDLGDADLIPFKRAATYIPSEYGGAVAVGWLHRRRVAGLLPFAVGRPAGCVFTWFLRGEDVKRLARGEVHEPSRPPSAVPVRPRSAAALERKLRELKLVPPAKGRK